MADKAIGKLTLDITDVEKKIKDINTKLASIGAGVKIDLSKQVANEVKKQLKSVEDEINNALKSIQSSSTKISSSLSEIGKRSGSSGMGTLSSDIEKTTNTVVTLGREVDATGKTIESVISTTTTGLTSAGQRIREITDASGNITKKIVDVNSHVKDALKVLTDYQNKSAQLYNMQASGKTDTAQYGKLVAEVNALSDAWNKVPSKIKQIVVATDEAKKSAQIYRETIAAINAGLSDKNSKQALENQVALYEKWYKLRAQADTYAQKGDVENADMYQAAADRIEIYIDKIARLNKSLDQQAQAEERVVQAHMNYESAVNSNKLKEQSENINAYKTALVDLLKAQTDFNNQIATGKMTEGSEKYKEAEANIQRLQSTAIEAGQKIDSAGRQVAESTREVNNAFAQLRNSEAAIRDSGTPDYLQRVTNAYNTLKEAINNYNIAKKAQNEYRSY